MERVLFWSNSELLIQICDRAPYIDIEARLENRYLKMLLEYSADSVFIEDLQGNGHSSGLQGQGTGSLLVNIAIQYLRTFLPPETLVHGKMSDAGDPKESLILEECRKRRSQFWQSFGLQIIQGKAGNEVVSARLTDLKEKRRGLVMGKYPKFILLENFVEKSERRNI